MERQYEPIRRLLQRVRARYRALSMLDAAMRAALAMSAVVGVALAAWPVVSLDGRSPLALACVGGVALVLAAGAAVWGLLPLRDRPSDLQVARFIEERVPALDDLLVTAVDVAGSEAHAPSRIWLQRLLEDAARRADVLDPGDIVPGRHLRRCGLQAGAAAVVLLVLAFMAREPARQSLDAASLALFPARARLDVLPGDSRVKQGTPLVIRAHLVGNRAPIVARLEMGDGSLWRSTDMSGDGAGRFHLSIDAVASDFTYRVVAGTLVSPVYGVKVAQSPHVVRIDVDYTYPARLGLPARTDTDGGDVYAPAGTNVRLHVYTDRPVADGHLSLANSQSIALATTSTTSATTTSATSSTHLTAAMTVAGDGSYRVALRDAEGLAETGPTEYFIRAVEDRPPDVHIVKPASDRSVTALEEIDVQMQADDDYGIERVELVYAVRGQAEKVVPLALPRRATNVTVHHTLYLEDLDVRPGDFVSYYARARDTAWNEGRSDIFFLEVRPFEQEFALVQSQSMAGSGYVGSIDDLVIAQKQIVVATWKLDRRGRNVKGAQSAPDMRAVARSEAELKARVEETASSLRESTMRDPRRRLQEASGQTMPEEDAMAVAADAMARAVVALDALKTDAALPAEMRALKALLEAQALVKKRQVSRQQSAQGGPGNNNRNYDISTLFDKELQRQQETKYETRPAGHQREANDDALERIRNLARRQDELLARQQELARQQLAGGERERQLEKLTREQSELRRQAEDLARQMAKLESGRQGQAGAPGQAPQRADRTTRQLREISDDMRSAASELRRLGSTQAGESGRRALEKLRDLERRLRSPGTPGSQDDLRRALGDLQLEASQLADAQRQVASELPNASGQDAMRRLAGEQQRLADRARRLQDGVKQSAAGDAASPHAPPRIAERMQQSAEAIERAAQGGREGRAGQDGRDGQDRDARRRAAAAQHAIASDLDTFADALRAAAAPQDRESRAMADQLARAQQLRDHIDSLTRDIEKLGRQDGASRGAQSAQKTPGQSGKTGEGQRAGVGGNGEEVNRLREQAAQQLRQTRELIDELRRQDPNFARGGMGFTFEGQGMTFSSPGTEAFKQDFAKWQALREQATRALERVEASLSARLQRKASSDRLAAGVDDNAPAAYRQQVDNYFKALAARKAP